MSRYVVDAPTLVHIVTQDAPVHPSHQLVAPNAIRSEALGLLFEAVGRAELTEREALRHHDALTRLRMRLLGDRVSRRLAWDIAREQGWDTMDDAEYLAVAKLQADALVTVDPAMAAKARGVVPVADVSALAIQD